MKNKNCHKNTLRWYLIKFKYSGPVAVVGVMGASAFFFIGLFLEKADQYAAFAGGIAVLLFSLLISIAGTIYVILKAR